MVKSPLEDVSDDDYNELLRACAAQKDPAKTIGFYRDILGNLLKRSRWAQDKRRRKRLEWVAAQARPEHERFIHLP